MTWPLATGVVRDVPGDFGDPLLNAWILAWDADHIVRALGGHLSALAGYWNANIFYPHPLALAYSEHLTAQALSIAPVWALTHNAILCYNLVFLASFALSGLGMYLWTRDLTGRPGVAFVAGLAFAFAPYRFGAAAHLQVISSAWMPFTLFGFGRFFARQTGGDWIGPLWIGTGAWILQNLSCGYYLLYFSPVVLLYIVWEMTRRGLWTDGRTLARLALPAVIVAGVTLAFLVPYLQVRGLGFSARRLTEVDAYSADMYGYLTADSSLRLWGWLQTFPKSEGTLFPGLTVVLLAAVAVVRAWRPTTGDRRRTTAMFAAAFAVSVGVVIAMAFGWTLRTAAFKITDFDRTLLVCALLGVAWLATSASSRAAARGWIASPAGILAVLTLFAVVMSLGPHIDARDRTVDAHNLYEWFYRYVPGYDGLRVPARFAMIVVLGLSALAALGLAAVARGRYAGGVAVLAGAAILAEGYGVPLRINADSPDYLQAGLAPLPGRILIGNRTPGVYRYVASSLPASAAIVELPFGEVAFDVRYQFYSTLHWRRLVNGYSGGAPREYGLLTEALKDLFTNPEPAWRALQETGATYAIVHETGYEGDRGHQVSEWLRAHGAKEIEYFYGDRLFALPRQD